MRKIVMLNKISVDRHMEELIKAKPIDVRLFVVLHLFIA